MNYQETLQYLFDKLPMYQRIGAAAYKADIQPTIDLLSAMGHPQDAFRSIHVAGTNGKGSTSHMLASILQSAGYKVGLYTSPHLLDFRERIKINGKMISESTVIHFVGQHQELFEKIKPSFFEMSVAMAFDYFAKEQVDIAVIEVGMGGRLDSTNVITPLVSVITNIGFDHTQFLGDTRTLIAQEKAGIIKPNIPCVIGETHPETISVFTDKAQEMHSDCTLADQTYQVSTHHDDSSLLHFDLRKDHSLVHSDLTCELKGIYQTKNICTVFATIDHLRKHYPISDIAIREGLATVVSQTGLFGRWQMVSEQPLMILDTGHNEDGIKQVVKQLSMTPHQQLHFVIGMVNDKDIHKVLSLLPKNAIYYFTQATIPRALDAQELSTVARSYHLEGNVFPNVEAAIQAAGINAAPEDLILVGGSTFVVADALTIYQPLKSL